MNALVIAPHADDEILGVGGTIIKLISQGYKVYICIVTRGYAPLFDEALVSKVLQEAQLCHQFLGVEETFFLNFSASMLEYEDRNEVNNKLFCIIDQVKPDVVFIPHYGDIQKDHEMIARSSMVALRPKYLHKVGAIYAYETVSETEWNIPHSAHSFIPNVFVDISEYINLKIVAMKYYASQLDDFPGTRSAENIEALAKYRGATIHVKAAEAFYLIRNII